MTWTVLFDFAEKLKHIFSLETELTELLKSKSDKKHTHNYMTNDDLEKLTQWKI